MIWWQKFIAAIEEILSKKTFDNPMEPALTPQPAPTTKLIPEKPVYDWSTPQAARHSIRVICDEEGLTVDQKNKMSQTLNCESGYGQHVVVYNTDRGKVRREKYDPAVYGKIHTIDAGICQWNNYYHGKEISTEEAESNPEKAVRLMCQYVKQGLLKQWVCYSSGEYLTYSA